MPNHAVFDIDAMCGELRTRAELAHARGEVWESPDDGKEYHVVDVDEKRILIHRVGTVNVDSPTRMSFKKVREILERLLSRGPILREKCPTYAFANSLAHLLDPRIQVDGKWLIAVAPVSIKDSSANDFDHAVANADAARPPEEQPNNAVTIAGRAILDEMSADLGGCVTDEYFDPSSEVDARTRTLKEIIQRRGQRQFRERLLAAFEARCAVTKCGVVEVLEAAHISRYQGDHTNVVSNGLLLRADIHTLFDLNLIGIDPSTLQITLAEKIKTPIYSRWNGERIRSPKEVNDRPSPHCLELRWRQFCDAEQVRRLQ